MEKQKSLYVGRAMAALGDSAEGVTPVSSMRFVEANVASEAEDIFRKDILSRHAWWTVLSLSAFRIPDEIAAALREALAKNPAYRYLGGVAYKEYIDGMRSVMSSKDLDDHKNLIAQRIRNVWSHFLDDALVAEEVQK